MIYVVILNLHKEQLIQFIMVQNHLGFLGPKIWEMLPLDLKNSDFLDSFKSEIKNWRPQEWPFRFCKRYIQQVGITQIPK